MSMTTEQARARAEEPRPHKYATAEHRRRDRGLVPVMVAAPVGIPVADLAGAMRGAGVYRQLTEAEGPR